MRAATVRHPRSIGPLEDQRAAVEGALSDSSLPATSRELLEVARERLTSRLAEVREPCERASLWRGADPGCSQLFQTETYATGVFDWLAPGSLAGVPDSIAAELYSPFGRNVPAGVWTGPLFVLADGSSASATEAFVAMLKDNGAATVIGERTYGAGCGYLDGGLPLELPNSGHVVWMPDCARYRIDGTNEIEGMTRSGIGGLNEIEEQHATLFERGPSRVSPFMIPIARLRAAQDRIRTREASAEGAPSA